MSTITSRSLPVLIMLGAAAMPVHAQWAVVDARAIVQLVAQVNAMKDAVQTAHDQLTQAHHALESMTGDRGMELLLSGIPRNYLPSNWPQLSSAMQGGGSSRLASGILDAITANAVLTPQQLATLPDTARRHIVADRQSKALQQALAHEALAHVSDRFASIQTLIAAIPSAIDQKAILDLQARIGAELGMLQNEQNKLQTLQQATQAEDAVHRQQEREYVVAGHGRFENRFRPAP